MFSVHIHSELLVCPQPSCHVYAQSARISLPVHSLGKQNMTKPRSTWSSWNVTLYHNLGSLSEESITPPIYLFHMYREWPCTDGVRAVTLLYLWLYCTEASGLSTYLPISESHIFTNITLSWHVWHKNFLYFMLLFQRHLWFFSPWSQMIPQEP